MANYSKKPQREQSGREEIIQQLNQLLTTAHKVAGGRLDPEVVNKLLSSVCETPTTPTVTEILEEVENEAGIKLNPGLVLEIKSSPYQKVKDAIGSYVKTYGKGGGNNPNSLFFQILKNEVGQNS